MSDVKLLRKRIYQSNDLIFQQGETSDTIYLIQEGTVELFEPKEDGQEKRFKLLTAGFAFGEQALISQAARPHSARALSEVLCIAVNRGKLLEQLDHEDPFISALFRILQTNMRSVSKMGKRPNKKEIKEMTEALTMTDDEDSLNQDPFK